MNEFSISDEVSTDIDPKPSTILSLGVEALEWQKMYSDSESESDYNPEYDDTGRVINYQSNTSASDSDEEFMCSLTRKKTPAQRGPKPRGGGGVGRGRRGRGARMADTGHRDVPILTKPPEDVNYASLLEPGIQPPPVLIKHQPRDLNSNSSSGFTGAAATAREEVRPSELRVTHLPSVPALVKAADRVVHDDSSDIEEFDRLTNIGVPSQPSIHPPHHIQPPPSLVMPSPSSSSSSHVLSSPGSQRRREPPPLVKNTDSKQLTPIDVQDSSHSSRPQMIRLSHSESPRQQRRAASGGSQSSLSYTIVTQTPQPSYSIVTQQNPSQVQPSSHTTSATLATSVDGRGNHPPKPRRPGRPRKDQSITSSTGLRTSAKTVRLGAAAAKSQQRSVRGGGRGGRGGGQTASSQAIKKGMKMTQYEFENVAFPSSIAHPQALQPQQQSQPPQLFQVASGSGMQSLVTPLQIIPAGSIPAYHGVSGGGMLLMQGAPQGVALAAAPNSHDASNTLITQGGNTYQLVQAAPVITAEQAENAQKVSVIMHPSAGVGAPVQYIAQFDGPPPPRRGRRGRSRNELTKKFEEERRKEQAKLEGSIETPKHSVVTESDPIEALRSSASDSAEKKLTNELERYLKMEETRWKATPAASPGAGSLVAAAGRNQPLPSSSSPNNTNQSTEASVSGTNPPVVEGEGVSGGKKTTGDKKSVLGKRKSTRSRVREEEEEEEEEPSNEMGDPLITPPPSKQNKTQPEETVSTAEEGVEEYGFSMTVVTESSPTPTAVKANRRRGKGHASESKPKHACDECDKEYASHGSLLNHKKMAHGFILQLTVG